MKTLNVIHVPVELGSSVSVFAAVNAPAATSKHVGCVKPGKLGIEYVRGISGGGANKTDKSYQNTGTFCDVSQRPISALTDKSYKILSGLSSDGDLQFRLTPDFLRECGNRSGKRVYHVLNIARGLTCPALSRKNQTGYSVSWRESVLSAAVAVPAVVG